MGTQRLENLQVLVTHLNGSKSHGISKIVLTRLKLTQYHGISRMVVTRS